MNEKYSHEYGRKNLDFISEHPKKNISGCEVLVKCIIMYIKRV